MSNAIKQARPKSAAAVTPLSYPLFRNIWLANLASNAGLMVQGVAAAWLMSSMTESEGMVASVQAAASLPVVLFSLMAGAIADNFDRRSIMLTSQVSMLVISIILALTAFLGWISPALLLIATFLIACGGAFNGPAWQASVAEWVPRPELPAAVVVNSVGFNIARTAGPALGGAIVAFAGAATAFAVNALSYVALLAVLVTWKRDSPPREAPPERLLSAMTAGLRYAALTPHLRRVLLRCALFCAASSGMLALMPLVARTLLGGGALTYGALLGAYGVGGVAGALRSAALARALSTENLIRITALAFGTATIVMAYTPWLPLSLLCAFIAGGASILTISTLNVTVQLSTAPWVLARALSLYRMSIFAGLTIGSWLWGVLAEVSTCSWAIACSGAAQLICLFYGLRAPLPRTLDLNMAPLGLWQEPETTIPKESVNGPVVVMVEYRIAAEDESEFRRIMQDRRRVRMRDGAQNWTLLRDLTDADVWIERYTTRTWTEYVRHNRRRTVSDGSRPR